MVIVGQIKTGKYYDSVSLMAMAKKLSELPGVVESAAVMGTEKNKEILGASDMLFKEAEKAGDNDLILAVKAKDKKTAEDVLAQADELLKSLKKQGKGQAFTAKSLESALAEMPDANMVLISVAGKYAAFEAEKALEEGLNVMMFSDNVSVEDEVSLKKLALKKGLLMMGPDCGTAIINGIPLAFANVVKRGSIGVVAASGTGLQEVTSLISNLGGGISQAIGTGGRDIKDSVGGLMFLSALEMLADDDETETIVLVGKPPAPSVLEKIGKQIGKIKKKTVIAVFMGAKEADLKDLDAIYASSLEEAAYIAVMADKAKAEAAISEHHKELAKIADKEASELDKHQKYFRGLFCGGTFASEAYYLLKDAVKTRIYGNVSGNPLKNIMKSQEHTLVDMGDDDFTQGRPHPMIDFSLRNKRIIEEAEDETVAVIQIDVVLGYGSNMTPTEELAPVIKEAKSIAKKDKRHLPIIFSVTGTDQDPQNRDALIQALVKAGAIYAGSNAAASYLTAKIISKV